MHWNWFSILWASSYIIGLAALFIVPANRKPGEATAWLLLIFLAPLVGAILFLLMRNPKLSKWRRAQQRAMNERLKYQVEEAQQMPELAPVVDPPLPARYEPFVNLIIQLTGMPAMAGNALELLPDYTGAVNHIVGDIDSAKRFVHIEYFMFADDKIGGPVIDALIRAKARGVICRVLIDYLGNFSYHAPVVTRLTLAGIPVHLMLQANPFNRQWNRFDLRNHRKIVIVDDAVAFTGSQNLIEDDYHKDSHSKRGTHYKELVVRVTGPVVREFNAAFLTDWFSETEELLDQHTAPEMLFHPATTGDVLCQVLPSGPGFDFNNNLMLFVALFHAARQRIVIVNPYVVPEDTLLLALTSAAQRGVEVTLIVSEIGDQFLTYHAQDSYYEQLLKAGIKIHRYRAPVILHAKSISIDDDIAVIGSSNMDIRSFQLNLEVMLVCYSTRVVTELRTLETEYLRCSRPLSLEAWQARPLHTKLFDNLARLTSALQ